MAEAGIEKGEHNEKTFRLEIRKKEGNDFVVKRIIDQIHKLADAGQHRIIADGLYTWDEYKILKHEFPGEITIIAVTAPKHLRYEDPGRRRHRERARARGPPLLGRSGRCAADRS